MRDHLIRAIRWLRQLHTEATHAEVTTTGIMVEVHPTLARTFSDWSCPVQVRFIYHDEKWALYIRSAEPALLAESIRQRAARQ